MSALRSCLGKTSNQGWTNQLYVINFTLTWVFVLVCLILTVFSGLLGMDLQFTTAAVPCAFAELGVHTACIVRKTEKENVTHITLGKEVDEPCP